MSSELLDRPKMAERISVSVPTFDRLSRRPGFPRVTVIRGKPLYNPVRVVEWLEAQSGELAEDGDAMGDPMAGSDRAA